MNNNFEYGLMIIWEKARYAEEKIINDLKTRFIIDNIFEVTWDKEIFSKNLSRFYGENLPKNSFKEKHCGNGSFLLIILKDENPKYSYRKTSKGKKEVNINFFDSKELYRKWTNEGHKIHATNDVSEFKHDLMMLLGLNIDDYNNKYKNQKEVIKIKKNVVANDGWNSLEEVFYVLNETIDYVVLRNFQQLPECYVIGEHGDIDILCENQYNLVNILDAEKAIKSKTRARYCINVNNEKVYFDLRFIGDNYYCKKWEKEILITRKKNGKFYIPNDENYKYSLLYHALVHKKNISSDYLETFNDLFECTDKISLREKLLYYMNQKKYTFVEANDVSVYFNEKNAGLKMGIKKKLYFKFYFIQRIYNKFKR